MLNVKPTTNHLRNIKKHKRFLEKWKMWEFAYFDGEDYYFVVHYEQITGKLSGYLILNQEGEDLPLEQVKSPAYFLITYNTLVHNTIAKMIPQMAKSMKPFGQMLDLLEKHKRQIIKTQPHIAESIEKIIQHIHLSLNQPDHTREIVYSLGEYQREVTRKKGYFDQSFLKIMMDEADKYREMMYQYGLRERKLHQDYEQLYQALQSLNGTIPKSEQVKLQNLLTANIESNAVALEKSLATFEKDDEGNELFIHPDNVRESLRKNQEEIGIQDFQKKIVPFLRNKL